MKLGTSSGTTEDRVLAARSHGNTALLWLGLLAVAGVVQAAAPEASSHFDARIQHNLGFRAEPSAGQLGAAKALPAAAAGLTVSYNATTGVTRTLVNPNGYLSAPSLGSAEPLTVALAYLRSNRDLLGLTAADLAGHEVTDLVYSQVTGATHIYLRQLHRGLAVYNAQMGITINRDGRVLSVNNGFFPNLAEAVIGVSADPLLDAEGGVAAAALDLGSELVIGPEVGARGTSPRRRTLLTWPGVSRRSIAAELMWLPIRAGQVRLVWNFQIDTPDDRHFYDFTVDASSGRVWTRFDWTSSAQYRVYAEPVESPNHTSPLPPADGRVLLLDPADPVGSPGGWHDAATTIMDGNNVHAYEDRDANNLPPASQPSCGAALSCDFPIDLTAPPASSIPAAVANLFYWNNTIHDIQYKYGFDEAAGNFQENNFGLGGLGSDSVNAEALDGSGNCNANFGTPPDGANPRMQMFTCTNTVPAADGDYDNGVIVHEYGHGISNRQVGGPSNSSCLGNLQQAGEGWSDWFALVYTAELGDLGTDARGIGTYLFGQPPNGPGIRTQPYSTDPAINNFTYESISGLAIPHGVGSVWAQVIWEMYWALVAVHGFDPDLHNPAPGWAGNQRALLYVNEGLKVTLCSPTFVNNRDAIIQVATDNFAGEDVCMLWEVFANFGLGTDAISGGPNSTFPVNGFSLPAACQPPVNAPPTVTITAPADNSKFDLFFPVTFSGTANDPEDGDISAGLAWTSDLDGAIGTGASFTTSSLSEGRHQITASVTDSGGLSASAVLARVEVKDNGNPPPGNATPVVTISAPADGSTFASGASISFAGTASDAEDGDLTAGLAWSSNLDGAIGTGGSFAAILSDGNHTVTASVTDTGGATGSDSIAITVGDPPPPPADSVTIAKALWDSGKAVLEIEGTASSAAATLTATFGARTEPVANDAGRFKEAFPNVTANPGTVTVTSSGGGSDTVPVEVK
ncbi:MAG: M36 family metallopeptidase [Thermoanaerobaculia bacterium]